MQKYPLKRHVIDRLTRQTVGDDTPKTNPKNTWQILRWKNLHLS